MEQTSIYDRLPLSGLHRDSAGNLIGVARAARTGIQVYSGYELNKPEQRIVRVWRPEAEVFHRDSMASFASVPVTIDHPKEPVTPENWRDHAVGETENDNIVRDGQSVKVPFIVRDKGGQEAIEDGKHEVSMGYAGMLDFTAGTVPAGQADEGQAYDAVLRSIRINHLAIVDKARGGPTLRIGDSETQERKMDLKTVIVDGLSVETTAAGETAISKLIADRDKARTDLTDAQGQVTTLTAQVGTLTGEKTVLEASLKDAQSPEKLTAAANARAKLLGDAKRVAPKLTISDSADDATIQRSVVEAKLGDAGKALEDNAIPGAFAALVAQAPKAGTGGGAATVNDQLADLDDDGEGVTNIADAQAARDKAKARRMHYLRTGEEMKETG